MAGAAVLTGLATEAVKSLTQLVVGRALEEIEGAWGLKDNLELIKKELERIQSILEDPRNSKDALNNENGKRWVTWVQRVKGLAYDADDVMDEYAIEMFRRKMEPEVRCIDKLCNFFKPSNPLVFRILMGHKVRKILFSFKELQNDATKKFFIDNSGTPDAGANPYVDSLSETRKYAAANAPEVVGRVADVEKLLEMICRHSNEERPISTLAIIGMGGLGKTTLARCIYDHAKTGNHFTEKLWTCVSEVFNITRILNDLIEAVASTNKDLHNEDAITGILRKKLEGKRFLLVLDGVWNENREAWGSLLHSLRRVGGLPGSVILITTRSIGVAEAASALFKHELKGLSEEESWSLFKHKVSVDGTPINSLKAEVGRRIVEKCDGVPLAIKVLGGLLMSRQYLHEWESIEKSEIWDLPQGENQILPSLMLSFNHLPSAALKQCFAYLSIFPKNTCMSKSELIGVWSSQGYLCNGARKQTSVEIGEDNLRKLLNSSLLQEDKKARVETVYYKMHDLVYDLAVYVSGNDLVSQAKDLQEEGDYRHLRITFGMNNTIFAYPPEIVLRKLRTVYWKGNLGASVPWNMLFEARYLRTLFLSGSSIQEVPAGIGLLKHLRYLDLSRNPIRTLPDSIGKLYQLETLVLQGCYSIEKLPKALYSLVNLTYIWTEPDTIMTAWKGLAQLSNVHVLPSLALEAYGEGWSIDELGKLNQLRDEVSIHGLECVKDKEEARKAGLSVKAKVSKLKLSWSEKREGSKDVSDDDVLDGLEPHPNITSLEVKNFNGEKLPPWIMTMAVLNEQPRSTRTPLSNLTEVQLLSCSRCCALPALGQLPVLERLTLSGFNVDCIGDEFYGVENLQKPAVVSFQRLIALWIINFQKLTTWMVPSQGAFPRLERLMVKYCPALNSLPDDLLHASSSLTAFRISDCPSLRNIPTNLEGCTSLQDLVIKKCPMIECPPTNFSKSQRLEWLKIGDYPSKHMKTLLESIQCLPLLCYLMIGGFRDEEEMRDSFSGITASQHLQSLRYLELRGGPSIKTLPRQLEHLSQVKTLYVKDFEHLEDIPDWICNISSLQALYLYDCKNLKDLPVKEALQRLPGLRFLCCHGCPLLSERYAKDTGPKWNDISHVTFLVLDIVLQDPDDSSF